MFRQAMTTTTAMSTVHSWRSRIFARRWIEAIALRTRKSTTTTTRLRLDNESSSSSIPQALKQQQQQNSAFHLVTWNVLAPLYAWPSKYPWTAPHHLDWSYRQTLLVKYLIQKLAHVVCLQEVQINLWPTLLKRINEAAAAAVTAPQGDDSNSTSSALTDNDNSTSSIYYIGILQKRTRHHPVACATLVRSDFATVVRTESDPRALITVLQVHDHNSTSTSSTSNHTNNNATLADQTFPTTTLHVANVHWAAGLDRDDTRSRQIQSLLQRLAHQVRQTQTQQQEQQQQQQQQRHGSHQSNPHSTSTPPCVILAGDWNMLRSNRNFDLLSPPSSPSSSSSASSPPSTGSTLSLSTTWPFAPLRSVYEVPQLQLRKQQQKRKQRRKRPIMTFRGGTVLDYVWISSQALTCQHVDVSTFDNDDNNSSRHRRVLSFLWPNERNPSDHLPVTVNLTINS